MDPAGTNTGAPTRDNMRAAIDRYVASYSGGDRAAWMDLFAVEAWIEDPVGSPRRNGLAAIGRFYDYTHSVAERIEMEPVFISVCGLEAAFHMRVRALVGGGWVEFQAIDVMLFDSDRKITAMRAFWDPTTVGT
ncbi:MAG TPA: nuclear transport factor 2 family protein [Candidatus Limnocylindria bacterium]|nr:nuclear transport factor 2 family protein [Candidatus Limnocylindria bacterium]